VHIGVLFIGNGQRAATIQAELPGHCQPPHAIASRAQRVRGGASGPHPDACSIVKHPRLVHDTTFVLVPCWWQGTKGKAAKLGLPSYWTDPRVSAGDLILAHLSRTPWDMESKPNTYAQLLQIATLWCHICGKLTTDSLADSQNSGYGPSAWCKATCMCGHAHVPWLYP
jgi:hypothetical protein